MLQWRIQDQSVGRLLILRSIALQRGDSHQKTIAVLWAFCKDLQSKWYQQRETSTLSNMMKIVKYQPSNLVSNSVKTNSCRSQGKNVLQKPLKSGSNRFPCFCEQHYPMILSIYFETCHSNVFIFRSIAEFVLMKSKCCNNWCFASNVKHLPVLSVLSSNTLTRAVYCAMTRGVIWRDRAGKALPHLFQVCFIIISKLFWNG